MNILYLLFICTSLALCAAENESRPYERPFKTNPVTAREIVNGWQKCTVLRGHTSYVTAVAFHPHDSALLASCAYDKTIRIWDITNPKKEPVILNGHRNIINSIAFHPRDRNVLASSSNDDTIRLWNITDPANPTILKSRMGLISSIAFNPHDPDILASASFDGEDVRVCNTASPKRAHISLFEDKDGPNSQENSPYIDSIAFSRDGALFACAASDKKIRLWRILQGEKIVETIRKTHAHRIQKVLFNSDGSRLASYDHKTICVYDTAQPQKQPQTLTDPDGAISSVAFDPQDSSRLISASGNRKVSFWKIWNS